MKYSAEKRPLRPRLHRGFAAAAALALALICALLIVNIPPVYDAVYDRFPHFAMHLKPPRRVCEDKGIRVELDAMHLYGPMANVYITVQDTTGNRLDEGIRLSFGDSWHTSFHAGGSSEIRSQDPENGSVTMLIEITNDEMKPVLGGRFAYHADYYICEPGQRLDDLGVDLAAAAEMHPATRSGMQDVSFSYSDEHYRNYAPEAFLVPGEVLAFSDKIAITAIGYVEDVLRVQLHFTDELQAEYNSSFNLAHENGDHYMPIYTISYPDESGEGFYMERGFDAAPKELKNMHIYCYHYPDEQFIHGNWDISWPLIQFN